MDKKRNKPHNYYDMGNKLLNNGYPNNPLRCDNVTVQMYSKPW